MPLYEYQCVNKECAKTFEIRHSFDSSPPLKCENCGEDIKRKFSAVPVIYKGSGFYTTDYKQKNSADYKQKISASNSSEKKAKSPTNKSENNNKNKTKQTDSSSKSTDTPKSTKK